MAPNVGMQKVRLDDLGAQLQRPPPPPSLFFPSADDCKKVCSSMAKAQSDSQTSMKRQDKGINSVLAASIAGGMQQEDSGYFSTWRHADNAQ